MEHIVEAAVRTQEGRGAARDLRRKGRVPGVMYGAGPSVSFSCEARDLAARLLDESFSSSVVSLRLDGKLHRALLREVQRDPVRRDILHVDFQAVREDREIAAQVPLHFINADSAPGVKLQHGIFTAVENQVALHCLPQNLPEYIEVDAGALEIGKSIHLSEIAAPPGARFDEIARGNDPVLAAVVGAAAEEPETVETPEAAGEDAPAESSQSGPPR
ncbi:MAG: 50S ribosomal protein L25/general stress protein Ctc [Gammaproteobacteria bacterium]